MYSSQLLVFGLKKLSANSFQLSAGVYPATDFKREANIFFTSSFASCKSKYFCSDRYFKSLESNSWYSSSDADPNAKFRNRVNCGSELRPQPSAIFVGMDAADLRIWLTNPYNSSLGYSFVATYILSATWCDLDHTDKSLKFFMTLSSRLTNAESCQLMADCFLC